MKFPIVVHKINPFRVEYSCLKGVDFMAMMECRDCFRLADPRSFQRCVNCGSLLCDDCAIRNHGFCEDCSELE